ncbi:MAG: DUF4388 domain-containing protein [Candidatus Krumholzibacteria bacterium]|nr:DUF4388 domain-containing protein [Candidatus Krumholzibacteria bacterium]
MDLEGNLAVFEPVVVFQLLHMGQCTGELALDAGHNSARLYFDRGDITYAEISLRTIKLGEYLVANRIITQRDLDSVLVKNRRGKRLGMLLVETGALGEEKLHSALEEQIKEVVYEAVRWRKGWFRFTADKRPSTQDVFIDVPLDHLMLEGLKRLDEEGGAGE